MWTICALRELNPHQWSLTKQSSLKGWKMMPNTCQTSWSQRGWCNKPTKWQFQSIFHTENFNALKCNESTEVDRRTLLHLHSGTLWSTNSDTHQVVEEQDKSSDIEQQPPFGDRKKSNIQPHNRGWGLQNQQEHHIILTKYEAVHPTAVSKNNSSSGMLII